MADGNVIGKDAGRPGNTAEVFVAFLKLGLTAFGGPVAHIGYFRQAFVRRRQWLDEAAFADLVALCQFLPGPASSQVGFGLGLRRAGLMGALAAWAGFTLPSAVLMTAFAVGVHVMTGIWAPAVIHGLKLVAVCVVAQAVWGMARTLTPDLRRIAIAIAACLWVIVSAGSMGQLGAIALGALAGLVVCRTEAQAPSAGYLSGVISKPFGLAALAAFFLLLVGLPAVAAMTGNPIIARFEAFYRSGALVFGGGHVVLPLLKQAVVDPGWVGADTFLAGYGAAQAMPGPLFTFAAFLGGVMNGLAGALLALVGIFLPGILALLAALPFWADLQTSARVRAGMRGANAAVVGLLAAALYTPVWTSAVFGPVDLVMVVGGFMLLAGTRTPPIVVVLLGAASGPLRIYLGV